LAVVTGSSWLDRGSAHGERCHGQPETIQRLEGMRIPRPAIACSLSARWVKPELLCVVQFAGWRAGGWRRDAVFAGWAE